MTRAPSLPVLAAACLAASAAFAQATHEVRGVVVTPGPGPAVKSTYPADGAKVPGGELILKLVFDQPMAPDAWSYGPAAGADLPDCLARPRLLADQRTFVLLCSVDTDHAYAVEINAAPRFAGADGRTAQPYLLKFSTTSDRTSGLGDALAQAGLAATDDPIMTLALPGPQGSQSAGAE